MEKINRYKGILFIFALTLLLSSGCKTSSWKFHNPFESKPKASSVNTPSELDDLQLSPPPENYTENSRKHDTNSLAQEGEYKSFPSAKDLEVEESPVPASHSSDNNSGNLLADYQRDLQSQPIPSEATAPLSRSENIPTTSYQTRAVENVASLPQEYSTQTYLPADSNSAALSGNTPDFSMDYNNRNNSYNTGNNYSGRTNNISPSMDTPAFPTMPNIPVSNETYNTGNAIAPNRVSGPESTQIFQDYQGNNQYSLNSPSPSNIQPQADPRNPSNTPNLQYNGYQTNGQEVGSVLSANGTYGGGNTENITYPSYTTIPSPYLPSTENGTASGFTPGSIGNY